MKQFHSEIPKLKTNYYHRVNQKEINVKSNLKQTKWNFFSRKIWNKSYQSFSTTLLGSWEIQYITWMLASVKTLLHTQYVLAVGFRTLVNQIDYICHDCLWTWLPPASSKEFLDIQATIGCGFTLKLRTWHDKNIQSNAPYRWVLRAEFNHFGQFGQMVECSFTN